MRTSFNKSRQFFHCPPNCPDRKPACQDHCPIHAKDKAEYEKLKAAEYKKKLVDYYVTDRIANDHDARTKKKKSFGKSNWRRSMK